MPIRAIETAATGKLACLILLAHAVVVVFGAPSSNPSPAASAAHENKMVEASAYLPYEFGDANMLHQFDEMFDAENEAEEYAVDQADRQKRYESGAMPGVLRFGKRNNQLALLDDLNSFEGASLLIKKEMPGVLRFGKRAVPGVLRFGKRAVPGVLRFGKRDIGGSDLPGVLRFGKRNVPAGVLRFGRR